MLKTIELSTKLPYDCVTSTHRHMGHFWHFTNKTNKINKLMLHFECHIRSHSRSFCDVWRVANAKTRIVWKSHGSNDEIVCTQNSINRCNQFIDVNQNELSSYMLYVIALRNSLHRGKLYFSSKSRCK